MREFLWCMIAFSLLFACATDCRTCRVYNFTWWISGAAALLLLVAEKNNLCMQDVVELGLFVLLQLLFFPKVYGRADCYAFSMCAVAETAAGMGFREYLVHMLGAFSFLAVVQAFCRNIDKYGNLKHPVPFLPYIALAFWALLWYHYTC